MRTLDYMCVLISTVDFDRSTSASYAVVAR